MMRSALLGPNVPRALLFAVVSIVVVGALAIDGVAAETTRTFEAAADAYVSQSKPKSNFGTAKELQASASPILRTYVRFDVSGLSGTVQKATLRVMARNGSKVGVEVRGLADVGWGERTITYATAPLPSEAVTAASGPLTSGRWVDLDVTALVAGNGPVSFVITTTSTAPVSLASREQSAASAPRLAVVTAAPEPPVSVGLPVLSGVEQVGGELRASRGEWSGSEPIEFGFSWRRCDGEGEGCVAIAGASESVLVLTAAEVGARVRVAVTATNEAGSVTALSAPSGVVAAAPEPVIAAAGDIACSPDSPVFNGGLGTASACRQQATSDLLVGRGLAAVLPLGDTQYHCAGLASFLAAYDPSWGRVKDISRPVAGNHEYQATGGDDCDATGSASGYFAYFGAAAGDPDKGYYSYDLGGWHLIALNSNCDKVGGCGAGSPQQEWLRRDLESSPAACTLAYWHHPRFTSGAFFRPGIRAVEPLFETLHEYRADVVLAGHDHRYERFAPQDPLGRLDLATGIRSFVVGTGGQEHHRAGDPVSNSELGIDTEFGVLEMTLRPGAYGWRFLADSGSVLDSGEDLCDGTAADITAPSTPAGLVGASPSAGRVDLGWSASTDDVGVVAYEIYRDGERIATTSTRTARYVDTTAAALETYSYAVRALDAAGNVSGASDVVSVRVPELTAYDLVVDADGPVAHFKLGDPAFGPYVDRVGGRNGTPRAMTQMAGGVLGNGGDAAALFNGTSSSISTAPGLNVGDTFTLEAWIKRNAVGTATAQAILSKRDGSWLMQISSTNRLVLRRSAVGDVGGSTATITDTAGWHHVAITKAGPAVKWYIDGVDVSPVTYTNQTMVDNTSGLFIGESGGVFFNGGIDEAAIYPTALSPGRIRAHYEAGI